LGGKIRKGGEFRTINQHIAGGERIMLRGYKPRRAKLKVMSETVGLPKTNLYAVSDYHFFLKVMATELEFVRGPDGKIEKVILDDEGEHYELKKIQ
jgi:hypothetical protein